MGMERSDLWLPKMPVYKVRTPTTLQTPPLNKRRRAEGDHETCLHVVLYTSVQSKSRVPENLLAGPIGQVLFKGVWELSFIENCPLYIDHSESASGKCQLISGAGIHAVVIVALIAKYVWGMNECIPNLKHDDLIVWV